MQLISKMLCFSQFIPYLEEEFGEKMLQIPIMAQYLKDELIKISNIKIINEVIGNILFAQFQRKQGKH